MGIPATRPPRLAESGYRGRPTVLNNVKTFAYVPPILNRGAGWFRSIGTGDNPGTAVFSLVGKVAHTGLVEVPMGTTLRQLIFDVGEGMANDKAFKAAQIGGPSGGCLPEAALDIPIDFDSLQEAGAIMGSGGLVAVSYTHLDVYKRQELALRIGKIIAALLGEKVGRPVILIGRDTRLSGAMLEGSLAAGITSAGAEVRLLGIAPTPAVAYLTRLLRATAGIMISASHNPIEDNGLKIFNSEGLKLPDELERETERIYFHYDEFARSLPSPEGAGVGRVLHEAGALERYLQHLRETASPLEGLRLIVDCGHGAACHLAGDLLGQLGADVALLHGEADGGRINVNCGATHTAALQREVVRAGAHAGIAFDGDADRLIAVDEKGSIVDGDAIMSICAVGMHRQGRLHKNTLVATVMSNGGLDLLGEKCGFKLRRTAVGDRYAVSYTHLSRITLSARASGVLWRCLS